MAIKFAKIKPGMVLYDVHSYRMGNTTMRSLGCWEVNVKAVDERGAVVSWNGNRDEHWDVRRLERLRAVEPEMERTFFGGQRLKRRQKPTPSPEPGNGEG
jgi:hypothetical protein